jgi:hypothetical protein
MNVNKMSDIAASQQELQALGHTLRLECRAPALLLRIRESPCSDLGP